MRYNKIFRILATVVILSLLAVVMPAVPVLAAGEYIDVTPNHGKVGDRVDVYAAYLNASARVTLYFSDEQANIGERIDTDVKNYEAVVPSVYANTAGELSGYFLVPSVLTDGDDDKTVRAGSYYVYLTTYGFSTILAFDTFTVESLGGITLDPDEGTVGTKVEITGEGFDGKEDIVVEYDGTELDIEDGDDSTDSSGDFGCTVAIPQSTAGVHTVTVIGQDSEIEAEAEFTVEPKISVNPASGTAGSTVSVNGTGFGDRVDFSIFFENDEVESGTTGRNGSFTATFVVPALAKGSYDVEVEDEDDNSATAEFTIGAATVSLSSTTGYAGDTITISGQGFKASSAITITFGGDTNAVTTATSDASGKFSASFTVPVRTIGIYKVKASDGTNTISADFSVSMGATITPTTSAALPGYIGTEITISGLGFAAGKTVTVTYDGTQAATAVVGTDGTFKAIFKAPASSGGEHTIIATDGTNTEQFSFFMELAPPSTVYPQLPLMDSKLEDGRFDWCGDATDLSKEVTDDSPPITYTLQIATNKDFSKESIVLEKTGLTRSEYTLTKEEKLPSVSSEAPYYWRVKAVDSVGNEGGWSGAGSFYVAGFTLALSQKLIYTLFGIGAFLLGLFGFWLGRKSAYY